MTIVTGTNSTLPNQIKWATQGSDPYVRESQLRGPVENFDLHDHASGKNLGVARVQTALQPSAAGGVVVNGDLWQWWGATAGAVRTAVDTESALGLAQTQLVNGGFETWQRGSGYFSANTAYTADRWRLAINGGSTFSVGQDGGNVDTGSRYALSLAYTHGAASYVAQDVEASAQLRGRTVTFTMRVRTATAGTVRLGVFDTVNSYRYSGYHSGSGVYETLAVTAPIAAGTTSVTVVVALSASCTAYLDNAVLVVGTTAPTYAPLHPADELLRCQRYYVEIGGTQVFEMALPMQAYGAGAAIGALTFPVQMAIAPTLTVSAPGDWRLLSSSLTSITCTSISAANTTPRSCQLSVAVTSGLVAGDATMLTANNTLAARLTGEANPMFLPVGLLMMQGAEPLDAVQRLALVALCVVSVYLQRPADRARLLGQLARLHRLVDVLGRPSGPGDVGRVLRVLALRVRGAVAAGPGTPLVGEGGLGAVPVPPPGVRALEVGRIGVPPAVVGSPPGIPTRGAEGPLVPAAGERFARQAQAATRAGMEKGRQERRLLHDGRSSKASVLPRAARAVPGLFAAVMVTALRGGC